MPIPARSDKFLTVLTNHNSVLVDGAPITLAPVDHFAIGLLMSKEKMAPVKPTTSENTINVLKLRPFAVKYRLTPSNDNTTDITSITARLVAKNKKIRFIDTISNTKIE
jgi:hypothetical protein